MHLATEDAHLPYYILYVQESKSAKLKLVVIDSDQKWKSHCCKGGLRSETKKPKMLKDYQIKKLHRVIDSLWKSKLRNGIQHVQK